MREFQRSCLEPRAPRRPVTSMRDRAEKEITRVPDTGRREVRPRRRPRRRPSSGRERLPVAERRPRSRARARPCGLGGEAKAARELPVQPAQAPRLVEAADQRQRPDVSPRTPRSRWSGSSICGEELEPLLGRSPPRRVSALSNAAWLRAPSANERSSRSPERLRERAGLVQHLVGAARRLDVHQRDQRPRASLAVRRGELERRSAHSSMSSGSVGSRHIAERIDDWKASNAKTSARSSSSSGPSSAREHRRPHALAVEAKRVSLADLAPEQRPLVRIVAQLDGPREELDRLVQLVASARELGRAPSQCTARSRTRTSSFGLALPTRGPRPRDSLPPSSGTRAATRARPPAPHSPSSHSANAGMETCRGAPSGSSRTRPRA